MSYPGDSPVLLMSPLAPTLLCLYEVFFFSSFLKEIISKSAFLPCTCLKPFLPKKDPTRESMSGFLISALLTCGLHVSHFRLYNKISPMGNLR